MKAVSMLLVFLLFACGEKADKEQTAPDTGRSADTGKDLRRADHVNSPETTSRQDTPVELDSLLDLLSPDAHRTTCPSFGAGQNSGALQNPDLDELSGLAAGRLNHDILWAHNDSGDGPRVFALDETGAHRGTWTLDGAGADDWEDMGAGPCADLASHCLYIGDIGDNPRKREHVTVYRVPEPLVPTDAAPELEPLTQVETFHLTYPDGPMDAEALFVDPQSADIYIIEKTFTDAPARVFMAAAPHPSGQSRQLQPVATIPVGIATAADAAPDGAFLVVRSYFDARIFPRPAGAPLVEALAATPCPFELATELQGEALAISETAIFTIAEGKHSAVNQYLFMK